MVFYVDDFVFFSELESEESRFKQLLNNKVATEFMGDANFFLVSSFKWNRRTNGHLSVHVYQQAFDEHTVSHFGLEDCNRVPLMTPYRSECPLDSIPNPNPDDPDLPKRKATYQSI